MNSAKLLLIGFIFVAGSRAMPQFPSGYRYSTQYCRDTLTARQLYVGEVFTRPGQCVRVQCLGTLQLWEDTCKVPVGLKGDCHVLLPSETNLVYPKCCPLYECKTFTSNPEGELEQTNTYDHTGNLRKSHLTEVIVINKDRLGPNLREGPTVQPNVRKYSI